MNQIEDEPPSGSGVDNVLGKTKQNIAPFSANHLLKSCIVISEQKKLTLVCVPPILPRVAAFKHVHFITLTRGPLLVIIF